MNRSPGRAPQAAVTQAVDRAWDASSSPVLIAAAVAR